jgi:hypothetical protein
MANYAPLRDAFSELNKMIIDSQQWNAQHETRQAEIGLKRAMLDMQMEDRALERRLKQREVAEVDFQTERVPVSLFDYAPNNALLHSSLQRDPTLGAKVAKAWGGSKIDPVTGVITN